MFENYHADVDTSGRQTNVLFQCQLANVPSDAVTLNGFLCQTKHLFGRQLCTIKSSKVSHVRIFSHCFGNVVHGIFSFLYKRRTLKTIENRCHDEAILLSDWNQIHIYPLNR